ncbi:hypothetical protein UUU_28900 [Klebsiella pneumoniae subsp. pneumoniae DSM 30104 = JCM 1662 = NBRC 14940]|nr:hypothetical protein UUU_28900 [Klebsiella pneumoniae subsp. pneumoniae DSM 30104 = JCM 1662 = NBRC 14940]
MVTQIEAADGRKIRLYHKIIVLPARPPRFCLTRSRPVVTGEAAINHLLRLIINI